MSQSKCAARVFGVALAMGVLIGAGFAFVIVLTGLRSAPSAMPDVESWLGSVRVSSVAALVGGIAGGIAGAITGAASWSVAALVLSLLDRRKRALPVRASAVGVGSAVGASLVLWFVASRPGVTVGAEVIVVLVAVAAGLAVVALLVSERIGRRSTA